MSPAVAALGHWYALGVHCTPGARAAGGGSPGHWPRPEEEDTDNLTAPEPRSLLKSWPDISVFNRGNGSPTLVDQNKKLLDSRNLVRV